MAKLLYFEMKKLFSGKLMASLLLFLFLFNGLMVYRESQTKINWSYTKADVGRVYDSLEGMTALEAETYLAERIELLEAVDVWRQWADGSPEWNKDERQSFLDYHEELMEQYPDLDIEAGYLLYLRNFYSEQKLLNDMYDQVSAVAHYGEYLNGLEEEAKIMTSSSLFGNPGTFSYRNIEKTPPVYEHLKGTVLPAEDSEGVLLATESRITDLLLLCLIFILALSMLIGERDSGTLLLIKPAKKGYLETITAKLLTMLFLAVTGTMLFYGTDFLLAEWLLGLGSMDRPIQSVAGYLTSPYALTVGRYLVVFLITKVLTAVVYASLLFCLCTVCRNGVSACLSMGAVLLLEFVLYLTIGIHSWLSPLKVLNLVCMADTAWFYGNYLNMNVFGYPVNVVPVCVGAALMVAILSCVISLRRFVTEASALSVENRITAFVHAQLKKRQKRGMGKLRIRVNLLGKEFYKVLVMERAWLLLAVLALLQWNSYRGFKTYMDSEEAFYRYYISWAEEVPLTEAARKYKEEDARFRQLDRAVSDGKKAYDAGELTYEEYMELTMELQTTYNARQGFSRAVAQYEYVLSQVKSGEEAELFCTTGWENLLGPAGQREDVMNAGKLVFFLAVGLAAVFSVEKTTGMELLLKGSIRGRGSVCLRKYAVCILYGTAAFLLAFLPRYLVVFSAYGTAGLSAPLKSLSLLSDVPFNVPLWVYLVLVGVSRYLGMLAAVGMILWLSKRTGNMIHTILISSLFLLLPVFLYLMGLCGETYFSLLPMMTGYSMYRLTAGRIVYWCAVAAIGIWFYIQSYEEGSAS